jgi:hypothetical protein
VCHIQKNQQLQLLQRLLSLRGTNQGNDHSTELEVISTLFFYSTFLGKLIENPRMIGFVVVVGGGGPFNIRLLRD